MSLAAKRKKLKQSETQIRERLNEQSDALERRFQTKIAKLAIAGGGILAGYALYKYLSEKDAPAETEKPRKKSKLNIAINSAVQDFIKSAIPYIMNRLQATDSSTNGNQAATGK